MQNYHFETPPGETTPGACSENGPGIDERAECAGLRTLWCKKLPKHHAGDKIHADHFPTTAMDIDLQSTHDGTSQDELLTMAVPARRTLLPKSRKSDKCVRAETAHTSEV